jgi:hypothetical protein
MEKYENSQFIIWGNDNKANQLEKNLEDSIKKTKNRQSKVVSIDKVLNVDEIIKLIEKNYVGD